jgi:hypothetical protein
VFNPLSPVIPSSVRECVTALQRKTVEIKEMKITGLEQLCTQLRFEQVSEKLANPFASL